MAFEDDWTIQQAHGRLVGCLHSLSGVLAFRRAWSSDCCLSLSPKWKALDTMELTLFINPALVAMPGR